MKILAVFLPFALLLTAGQAHAAQPVTLKAVTATSGAVTLGDLFDDAGAAASVVIAPPIGGKDTVLNAADVQRAATQNGLSWANEAQLRYVIVRSDAAGGPAVPVPSPQAKVKGDEVLTFAHSLETGEIVQADDLVFAIVPKAPAGAANDADDLIGKAVKHPVRTGAVASRRDVSAPMVIKRDDLITVTFQQDGIRLELQARAKASAALGETLSVQNINSAKIFTAVASGPGHALVGPDAEALRATALTDPSRLALR